MGELPAIVNVFAPMDNVPDAKLRVPLTVEIVNGDNWLEAH